MSDAKRLRVASGVSAYAPAPPQHDAEALQAFHHGVYFDSYAHLAVHQVGWLRGNAPARGC